MTVTDQAEILNRKIKQNEVQYDLDREADKISALSSNNLDKYEYLTGEDLGLKPSTVEQPKFEYSPLGKNSSIKKESDYNFNNNFAFYKFYRDFHNFKDRSLESKYNDISNFYKTLNEFKNHKRNTDETQQHKNKVINNVLKLYNNYFDSYEKTFNETNETFDKTTLDKINPYQFKTKVMLREWLESKNDFDEAKKLIDISKLTLIKSK